MPINDAETFLQTLETTRTTLDGLPPDYPELTSMYQSLANSAMELFSAKPEYQLLNEIIRLQRRLLELREEDHRGNDAPARRHLADLIWISVQLKPNRQLLLEALVLERTALAMTQSTESIMQRCSSFQTLARKLHHYHGVAGNEELLSMATDLWKEALVLCTPGTDDNVAICQNLAVALKQRYDNESSIGLLLEANDLLEQALQRCPTGHRHRGPVIVNLASTLQSTYMRTGEEAHLSRAIELEREALTIFGHGHVHRGKICNNLASSLDLRFLRTKDVNSLLEAIEYQREAFNSVPNRNLDRSTNGVGLIHLLCALSKHRLGQELADQEPSTEAVDIGRKLLIECPPAHPQRPDVCLGLTWALSQNYRATNSSLRPENHTEIIDLLREALSDCPAAHPKRISICMHLAASLMGLYFETGTHTRAQSQELSDLCHIVIEAGQSFNTWRAWIILASSSILLSKSDEVSAAIVISYILNAMQAETNEVAERTSLGAATLDLFWDTSLRGKIFSEPISSMLLQVQRLLVQSLPLITDHALDQSNRMRFLRKYSSLGSDALVISIAAHSLRVGVEVLEHAHDVMWKQALRLRDPQLNDIPQNLALELEDLLSSLAGRAPSDITNTSAGDGLAMSVAERDIRHRQNGRIQSILQEIRSMPGMQRFMLGEPSDNLLHAAKDHPVVLLVNSRGMSYAIVITSGSDSDYKESKIESILLDFNADAWYLPGAVSKHRGPLDYNDAGGDTDLSRGMRVTKTTTFVDQLAILWRKVVEPVITHLGLTVPPSSDKRPRIHWITTGPFSTLPIHAAGLYDSDVRVSCADYCMSSYVPSLSILRRAQNQPVPVREHSNPLRLIMVAEEQSNDPSLPLLRGVVKEVEEVTRALEGDHSGIYITKKICGSTKVDEVVQELQSSECNILHLACHGIQDVDDALRSAFCLGDGKLSVSKIMGLGLHNPFLAFLSACDTAKGDKAQPDQAIHLAATMLFAGFSDVVATLWSIADEDGSVFAGDFYTSLLEQGKIDSQAVAFAVDAAVNRLRKRGVPPQRWAPFIHMGA